MNLIKYGAIQLYKFVKAGLKPETWNCWLKLQTHDWNGNKPEPGWSTAKCETCGRVKVANL